MNFYAIIIGTEILNARREDKHFSFLLNELQKYGHTLFASFIIKDDSTLIKNCFELIKNDKDAILFSFGGIGSTPDDLTREIAADVFTSMPLQRHKEFEKDIIDRFKEEAYPHRVHMADLPKDSSLIKNPINNMSGFSLEDKYFFVPGFPQMAHPMLENIISSQFSCVRKTFRKTLLANTSENTLIEVMKQIPSSVELSSLPILKNSVASVEISLSSENENEVKSYFKLFTDALKSQQISYKLL